MCLPSEIKRFPSVCLLSFAIILLVLFLSVNLCYAGESDKALKYYEEGLKLFNAGQYEKAVEAFKEAVRIKPDYVDAYESLGFAFYKLNQYEKEIESYQKILKFKPGYAKAHYNLGVAFLGLKQHEKAIKSLKESIRLDPDEAESYKFLGFAYGGLKQYEKAIEAFKEVARLKPEDADAYYHLGLTYTLMKQYEKAKETFKEAIRLRPNYAEAYTSLGITFYITNQYEQAKEVFEKALKLKPDALTYIMLGETLLTEQPEKVFELSNEALKLKTDSAEAYTLLGRALALIGKEERSIEAFKKAIQINPDYAEAHYHLGIIYSMRDNFNESVNHLRVALDIYKRLSDKEGEANVLLEIGRTNLIHGKHISALIYLQDALKKYQELQDLKGEGNVLLEIADVYNDTEENDKALEYVKKALVISEQIEDKSLIIDTLIFMANLTFSIAENSSKNYEEAMRYAKQAEEIAEKAKLKNDKIMFIDSDISSIYTIIGFIYLESDNYDKAMNYGEKLLTIAKESKSKHISDVLSLFLIGSIYDKRGDYKQALNYYQKIIDNTLLGNSYFLYWRLGYIADKLGNSNEAKSQYFKAINLLEISRQSKQSLAAKISMAAKTNDIYNDTILFLLKTNEQEEAFNYTERAKARTFLDLLGSRFKLQDKEIFEEERRLQFKINYLTEKIREVHENPDEKVSPQLGATLEKQLNEVRSEYVALLDKIKKENPELSTLLTVNPLNLKEVQELLDSDTTLLEYFITPDKTLLWVVGKSDLKVIEIAIKDKELTKKVDAFREKIAHLEPDYKKDADELYDLLIKPAKPYIKTKKMGIIPHSVLHYLPFQALLNDENSFLIEEYEIFYSPSASVLKFVYEKRKMISDKVLAFGNPDIGDEKLNLPYAEDEVKKIKDTYPDTALYLKDKATEERAKSLSGDYNIIHFASHAELNPMNPMFSSIRLVKDKDEDGRLEVNEIFNLNLKNTSLVTLSACETGLGKLTQGDELVGLTRGFIYAGTPSIVVSLWKVYDPSTSEFMSLFYRNLKSHSKSEALRMAQLEMIRGKTGKGIVRGVGGITTSKEGRPSQQSSMTGDGSHPYFWAPFILVGDWK